MVLTTNQCVYVRMCMRAHAHTHVYIYACVANWLITHCLLLLTCRCGITNRDDACLLYSVTLTISVQHFSTGSIRGSSVLQMTKQLEYGTGNLARVLGQYYIVIMQSIPL